MRKAGTLGPRHPRPQNESSEELPATKRHAGNESLRVSHSTFYRSPLLETTLLAVHEQKNLNSPLTSAEDQGIKGGARVEDAEDAGRQ